MKKSPVDPSLADADTYEPPHHNSLTGVVTDALASGVSPLRHDERIRHEDSPDPDADPMELAFLTGDGVADDPDRNDVDGVGRMYGVSEPDGDLQLGDELINGRDERRWELDIGSREESDDDTSTEESFVTVERDLDDIADESEEEA